MFAVEIEEIFFNRMREKIRAHEDACGKGIESQWSYAQRVGEIRGYRNAMDEMRKIVSKQTQEEQDDSHP